MLTKGDLHYEKNYDVCGYDIGSNHFNGIF